MTDRQTDQPTSDRITPPWRSNYGKLWNKNKIRSCANKNNERWNRTQRKQWMNNVKENFKRQNIHEKTFMSSTYLPETSRVLVASQPLSRQPAVFYSVIETVRPINVARKIIDYCNNPYSLSCVWLSVPVHASCEKALTDLYATLGIYQLHTHTHVYLTKQATRKGEAPIVLATRDRLTDKKER